MSAFSVRPPSSGKGGARTGLRGTALGRVAPRRGDRRGPRAATEGLGGGACGRLRPRGVRPGEQAPRLGGAQAAQARGSPEALAVAAMDVTAPRLTVGSAGDPSHPARDRSRSGPSRGAPEPHSLGSGCCSWNQHSGRNEATLTRLPQRSVGLSFAARVRCSLRVVPHKMRCWLTA
jgi:hypothetical protein